jgi:hypothetical protein
MIANRNKFAAGMALMASFLVVLVLLFMPLLNGQNALQYLDALYNSISKGSAYYIPHLKQEAEQWTGKTIELSLALASPEQSSQSADLFSKTGAIAIASEKQLAVNGDMGGILNHVLADADLIYHNEQQEVSDKYNQDERRVLFNWWNSLIAMEKALKQQKHFDAGALVAKIRKKAVETAFNYHGIGSQKISDRYGIVIFSLIFYVIYTLWYGFAIMYLFEGWGMKLEH